ncbi:MAG TPA: ferredoxin [Streptosporangiaceae bacterium]|nr:ferredoxin [Streptosporangiaceae bacterium]
MDGGTRGGALGVAVADDRPWRYCDVPCARCGAVVQVAKFSPQHTSVQWTGEAVLRCAEFAAEIAAGRTPALVATCASMRASIDDAVAAGRVEVLPP